MLRFKVTLDVRRDGLRRHCDSCGGTHHVLNELDWETSSLVLCRKCWRALVKAVKEG